MTAPRRLPADRLVLVGLVVLALVAAVVWLTRPSASTDGARQSTHAATADSRPTWQQSRARRGTPAPMPGPRHSQRGARSASPLPREAGGAGIAVADLPEEAQRVHRLLMVGGPFAHDRDGVVFGNYERRLPAQPRGYYREFTVRTPGERDRGARRLVVGGCGRQTSLNPTRATPCGPDNPVYWTDDHYETFRRVR